VRAEAVTAIEAEAARALVPGRAVELFPLWVKTILNVAEKLGDEAVGHLRAVERFDRILLRRGWRGDLLREL
jgi:hypothetical protein